MDSFEINKIMGAVLATLLGLMVINIGAGAIFAPHMPEKPGYEIAVAEPKDKGGEKAAAAEEEPLGDRIAKADPDRGKAIFKRCMACHTVEKDGPNRVGPNLYGVIGRVVATHAGFNYSSGMQKHGGSWTPEEFDDFIKNPKQEAPGTSMVFAGLSRGSDRADLIVFLNLQSDKPVELPKAGAAKPDADKAADAKSGEADAAADKKGAAEKPAEGGKPQAPAEEKPGSEKPAEGAKPDTKPDTKPSAAPAETEKPADGGKPEMPGMDQKKPADDSSK